MPVKSKVKISQNFVAFSEYITIKNEKYHNFPINTVPLFTVIEEKSSSERSMPALESTLKSQIEEFKSRESRGPLPVPAGGGYPKPLAGDKYPAKPPEPVPPPAAPAPILKDFSAPPPPMLRDSSEFQTITELKKVSTGTNPLDRIYKASKQKELEERQNIPLEDIDLREKLNYSKKHGYHPTQGNLLGGIDNWSFAAYKNQSSLTTVLASISLYFN